MTENECVLKYNSLMNRSVLPVVCLAIIFALCACQFPGNESTSRPNIIYIMSDDHTAQAFGVYGSRLATLDPTPTIDRIAREGMLFENCFCTNSICTPSRASILTGQYPQTNGVLDLDGNIPPEKQYLPMEMQKLGYETAMICKWHLKKELGAFDDYCVRRLVCFSGTSIWSTIFEDV